MNFLCSRGPSPNSVSSKQIAAINNITTNFGCKSGTNKINQDSISILQLFDPVFIEVNTLILSFKSNITTPIKSGVGKSNTEALSDMVLVPTLNTTILGTHYILSIPVKGNTNKNNTEILSDILSIPNLNINMVGTHYTITTPIRSITNRIGTKYNTNYNIIINSKMDIVNNSYAYTQILMIPKGISTVRVYNALASKQTGIYKCKVTIKSNDLLYSSDYQQITLTTTPVVYKFTIPVAFVNTALVTVVFYIWKV